MIRQSSIEPTIIEYLKTRPSRETLKELIASMGISVREKGTPYENIPGTRPPLAARRLENPRSRDSRRDFNGVISSKSVGEH